MNKLRRLGRLSPAERRLLAASVVGLLVCRPALSLLGAGRLLRVLARWGRPPAQRPRTSGEQARRVAWAVGTAAYYVPGATCLTRALTAQLLLARGGHAPRFCLGVARGSGDRLEAHAWVECDGLVISTADPERYTRLPDIEARVLASR